MKNLSKFILLAHIMLLGAFSCEKEEIVPSESDNLLCRSNKKTVKNFSDASGFIWFNQPFKEYAIYTNVDGTYDSQMIGLPCNLPVNFKKDGLKVKFSGKYKDFGQQPTLTQMQVFPGQEYYYLEISKIQLD